MSTKEIKVYGTVLSSIAVAALLYATYDLEYGYYQFLRIFITIAAVISGYAAYRNGGYVVSVIAGIIAIVFNPIAPVTLEKETWIVIDALAALYFLVFAITLWTYKTHKEHKQED